MNVGVPLRVGLIGLGAMGDPMARNLLAAGFPLTVWARRPEVADPLLDLGALWADSPAALGAGCDVVLTMVTRGEDVLSLVQGLPGQPGLDGGMAAGTVHVDCSTIPPGTARELGALHRGRGRDFVDAPVSGGAVGAEEATLAIMAGGDEGVIARLEPLFLAVGSRLVRVGGQGAGQVAKLCNQLIMVSAIEAVAEALHFAQRAGADPERVREALAGGSAASRVLDVMGARMVERDFEAGVEARLHHKDFAIIEAAAFTQGVPLPLGSQVAQQLNRLMDLDWGREDTAALIKVLEGR